MLTLLPDIAEVTFGGRLAQPLHPIREAGGRISDFHGGDGYLESGNVVAGNPKTYAALSKLLAPFSAGVP